MLHLFDVASFLNRANGGLGEMDIPIISDTTHALAKAYGVLKGDEGIAYRGLFIIDPKGKASTNAFVNPNCWIV